MLAAAQQIADESSPAQSILTEPIVTGTAVSASPQSLASCVTAPGKPAGHPAEA